jgi:protoporphyrinogen oxidase
LISTLPITVLVRLLGDAVAEPARRAARELRFRSLRLLFLRIAQSRVSECASIYLPDPGCVVSRLVEPRNRSSALAPPGETALVAEIPCWPGDALATRDEALLAPAVIETLERLSILRADRVLEWRSHLLENAYPVSSLGVGDRLAAIEQGLAPFSNLDRLGRGGRFWYSHLHDQLRAAKDYLARRPDAGTGVA